MRRPCVLPSLSQHRLRHKDRAIPPQRQRQRVAGPGVQYACGDYILRLQSVGIQPSMSRSGCPYDNAMAESFMKTLKQEEVDASSYRDLAHATAAIGEFLENVYNRQRLHSALAYLSPAEFESTPPLHPVSQLATAST